MQDKYTYLLVDFFCIVFPFLFSFHPKINFHRQWRFFLLPCLLTAFLFLVWDVLFTRAGVWNFNPRYVCGLFLLGLPLEEYLFFICIPYACVFTYFSLTLFYRFTFQRVAKSVSLTLIGGLSLIAAFHLPQLYTSFTFLLLSVFLLGLLVQKADWMPAFYISFLAILLPFIISNGILTGSVTEQPVVIYNNSYNLGIRILTIPIEDTFYGMLLLLMNVAGFEYLKNRKAINNLN